MHKPVGATSYSVVESYRQAHGGNFTLKVAHGGTLDPFASGLLPILVGAATRIFELIHELPKTYVACVEWGRETDSGDALGKIVAHGDRCRLSGETLNDALSHQIGWTMQEPPAMSNKRVDGERAWVRARRGEEVTLRAERVYLHEAQWLRHELPERSFIQLTCRGGFYVRSLAVSIGRSIGCLATLSSLHRTVIGPWSCPPIDTPTYLVGPQTVPWLPSHHASDHEVGQMRAGESISRVNLHEPEWAMPNGFPVPRPWARIIHRAQIVGFLEGDRSARLLPGGV